jgi:transposase
MNSKIQDYDWNEVFQDVCQGSSARELEKKYDVSYRTIWRLTKHLLKELNESNFSDIKSKIQMSQQNYKNSIKSLEK